MGMEKRVPLENYIEYPEAEMRDRVTRFTQNLLRRRTVRDYSDKPVERAVIEQAIIAAGSAPSGANHQPWHFVVLNDADKRRALREAAEAEEAAFYLSLIHI